MHLITRAVYREYDIGHLCIRVFFDCPVLDAHRSVSKCACAFECFTYYSTYYIMIDKITGARTLFRTGEK